MSSAPKATRQFWSTLFYTHPSRGVGPRRRQHFINVPYTINRYCSADWWEIFLVA